MFRASGLVVGRFSVWQVAQAVFFTILRASVFRRLYWIGWAWVRGNSARESIKIKVFMVLV